MKDYKKVSAEDIAVFKERLLPLKPYASEYNAGSLVIWSMEYGLEWKITHDRIIFRMQQDEHRIDFFIPDFGRDPEGLVQELLAEGKAEGKKIQLCDFSEDTAMDIMERMPGLFNMSYNRDQSDYIYNVDALIRLPGKHYHEKKNHVNKFKRTYSNWEYKSLSAEDGEECLKLEQDWIDAQAEVTPDMEYEMRGMKLAFRHWDELELFGGAILVNGKMAGFTVGEWQTDNMTDTHFEKGALDYDGIYQILNQQFSEHELGPRGAVYVNREEDMGIEGLRKSKESYKPDIIFHKYNLMQK
ncbi:MAG: phosphatidylglycerol lysyltransferase domain-containing protein [Eubacterium sp.]|nr:phosphatidylglycerol lysyltransferase domain-containing protein [Eubacterium sp.]